MAKISVFGENRLKNTTFRVVIKDPSEKWWAKWLGFTRTALAGITRSEAAKLANVITETAESFSVGD